MGKTTLNKPLASTGATQRPGRPRRLYEQIAAQVLELAQDRDLKPGDRLPNERELARLLGASRPSIREAMIALETTGIVEVRTGDGSFVRAVLATTRPLAGVIPVDPGPGPQEQFQARKVIEPVLAAMAAVQATDAEIDQLQACVDEMADVYPSLGDFDDKLGHRFHVELARAARNSILASVVQAMWDLRDSPMWLHLRRHVVTEENRRQVVEDRRKIVAAMRNRDPMGARTAMTALLDRAGRRYFGGEW
jgi:DNA-binding FadR family transcriptional regulator